MRIFMTGFMTSGKSTIGPIVANTLGLSFFDLDKVIVGREGMSIVEIFEKKGEDYFRKLERNILDELCQSDNVIISLGGGTIANPDNLEYIKRSGLIIYLQVSPEILYKRLKNKIDRPLFRDLVLGGNPEKDFVERIREMLDKRKDFYEKADIIINTDFNPIGVTVDKIASKLSRIINEKN